MGYRVEAERIFHRYEPLVCSLYYGLGSREWGELILRATGCRAFISSIISSDTADAAGCHGQSWRLLEAAACPSLPVALVARLQIALPHRTHVHTRALCSALQSSLPGAVGEPCAMAQHLSPPVPENKGCPVRVPPVTSAPENLGSMPRHKGASVRASLHWGSVGGSSFQGGHVAWQVALASIRPLCIPLGRGTLERGMYV